MLVVWSFKKTKPLTPSHHHDSPEHQLLHLVVFLISQDFELLVELLNQRLAVLQVTGQLSLALHALAALRSRHVLETRGGIIDQFCLAFLLL